MAGGPYEILGVKADASAKEIQSAYRRQAKKLHPDLNPGDKDAERKFKELSAAYTMLNDTEKRARFDRGEIDASGNEQAPKSYYRDFAGAQGAENHYRSAAGFADMGGAEDIFAQFFSSRGQGGFHARGEDSHYRLEIDFLDAVNGATRQITLPGGNVLDVVIPPGTRDGQILRLRGKGEAGAGGAEPGDALIELGVRPHRFFIRSGDDIRLELPISLSEAVLGGKVQVPTPSGPVLATIPPGSNSGKVLRLKGKGVPRRTGTHGDEYVTLKIMLPDIADADLKNFAASWPAGKAHQPRKAMEV